MEHTLDAFTAAVAGLVEAWPGDRVEGASGAALATVNDRLGAARRLLDALTAQVASEIARQSRPELGAESLAKRQGHANATQYVASELGISNGEAARFVQVGEATAPRLLLTGEQAPAVHPHVAAALAAGRIGTDAAAAIIRMLDEVAPRAVLDSLDEAERMLAAQAEGLTLDQLRKVITRAEAYLDPDGVAPKEEELRQSAGVHVRQDRSGMIIVTCSFDPERGAPVVAALEALVKEELYRQRDDGSGRSGLPPRSIPQMQADAMVTVFEHFLGCAQKDTPLAGATVVVRVGWEDLQSGTGVGLIDGIDQPVCIATVRRMLGGGSVVGWITSNGGEVLDWGRRKRDFTGAQKMLLVERDGGCAGCGAPPGRTHAHHIRWWSRGGGTGIDNGILLCSSCHHRIHDNGWDIRIDGTGVKAKVWLIPPPDVDPSRSPRPAARRRFDYVPA